MPRRKKTNPRQRKRSLTIDHQELANYIDMSLRRDLEDRTEWNTMRIQRYAKLRGWRESKSFPWANASNAHLPFLITEALRTQDTIHNSVLSRHPVCESVAVQSVNMEKQRAIDNLLDYQLFVEQPGEEVVATLIQQYVQDGVFLAYVPWVRYDEAVTDIRIFAAIAPELSIAEGVVNAIRQVFPNILALDPLDEEGFRWKVQALEEGVERDIKVEAYIQHEGGRLELSLHKDVRAYDGPVVIPKSVDEWVVPWRSTNVQPPSPSNPGGADHVILIDYPTLDEIRRLHAQGFYDAMTNDDMDHIDAAIREDPEEGEENAEQKAIKDEFEGIHGGQGRDRPEDAQGSGKLTRLQVFLGWDVNGDTLQEQIVVWMIRETKTILRVRYLTEAYPSDPPLRPLASAGFLPVEGRIYAISQLELLESIHDLMKTSFDQMVDGATMKNIPWFTYRPSSGLNPETIHIAPGEGVPMNDPRNDIFVPQFTSQGETFGLNMVALLTQFAEKASLQGDIQFGRVPQGKASALRTASGMQSILAQGDARPERIMRRFFSGFKDIYRIMHELNQRFLPAKKQFRLMEPDFKGRGVYESVDDIEAISGRMQFMFKAGMFNTNKETAQQVFQMLMQLLVNPMTLQLGIVGPEEVHRLLTDFIKLAQQDPTRYLKAPQPGPPTMQITAEEAVSLIVAGRLPQGTTPREGFQEHLRLLRQFMQRPEAQELSPFVQTLLQVYLGQLQREAEQQQQQQQLLQAAQQFQQAAGGGQGRPGPQAQGPAPNTGPSGNAPVNSGELLNETLPGAR